MIRSPLQHHRSRVPAIPPRVQSMTLRFSFDWFDLETMSAHRPDPQWMSFLTAIGLNNTLSYAHFIKMYSERGDFRELISKHGGSLTIERMPRLQATIFTVTRPARLSPKLLATFPWKLRRLIKS